MRLAIDTPIIYLITRGEATPSNFAEKRKEILDVVEAAVAAGVTFVQLREKQLNARLVFELASDAAALTRGTPTRLLINDRADIAVAAGADGVQLTSNSLSTDVVRKAFARDMIIGVSNHSIDEIKQAKADGADLALFGPIFETPGKVEAKGLGMLQEVCEQVRPLPVIGIGGIDATNFGSVLDAGAHGFAAIRALNDAQQMRSVMADLKRACSEIADN